MNPSRTYEYMTKSRARMFQTLHRLSPEQYGRVHPIGLGTIGTTLAHMMNSEWYYVERLEGRETPAYSAWPIQDEAPPGLDVLEAEWGLRAETTRKALAAPRDWLGVVSYVTVPDETGVRKRVTTTAGDVATQLVLHEIHHRAQVMAMVRLLDVPGVRLEDLDYNTMMYRIEEVGE